MWHPVHLHKKSSKSVSLGDLDELSEEDCPEETTIGTSSHGEGGKERRGS
jgi:hypothetical protein